MSRIGKYRQRIEIQSATVTANEFGEQEQSWNTDSTEWAQIEPLSGREIEYAKALVAEVTHKVSLRYRSGVTVSQRVKFGSRLFDINAAINVEELNIELQLLCAERVA